MSRRRRNKASAPVADPAPQTRQSAVSEKRKLSRNTYLAVAIAAVLMVAVFLGRWIFAIKDAYFNSIVGRDASVTTAMDTFTTIHPTGEDALLLLPAQKEWDLFTSSRLRDEVTLTADDGVTLHGYLFDEGSDITVVALHKYNDTGASDFLPGAWLQEELGCNLLLPDLRAHGGSGGDYVGFGYLEQHDLACWLEWAEETLGEQTFLIWGVGSGANTALYAEAGGLLPPSVALVVAESPYASFHELARHSLWETFEIPAFPFLPPIEWKLASSDAGYTVDDLELAQLLGESRADVPVLFLTSEQDAFILPQWTREVYDAYPGEKLSVIGGGGHGTVSTACADVIRDEITARMGR